MARTVISKKCVGRRKSRRAIAARRSQLTSTTSTIEATLDLGEDPQALVHAHRHPGDVSQRLRSLVRPAEVGRGQQVGAEPIDRLRVEVELPRGVALVLTTDDGLGVPWDVDEVPVERRDAATLPLR